MTEAFDPASLSVRDLRRLVSGLWNDPRCDAVADRVLTEAVTRGRRSLDRALILAWLGMSRTDHPQREQLGRKLASIVPRHEWAWTERGARWHLWNAEEGPRRLAQALLASDEPLAVLREAGIEGDLLHGAFARRSLRAICAAVQTARGNEAEIQGRRLIDLFRTISATDLAGAVLLALVLPWRAQTPSDAYRRLLLDYLLQAFGDPRIDDSRWAQIARETGHEAGDGLVAILRRWLTERSFKQFFQVVGKTTNDPMQWEERQTFWQGYLDRNVVSDAWFALGRNAEDFILSRFKIERHEYARIAGGSADPSHSALVLCIGKLVMAEWSHNGACRFWRISDRQVPKLYRPEYFDHTLRAMNGGDGFDRLSHTSSWQWRFAHKIYQETGITHPKFGEGLKV